MSNYASLHYSPRIYSATYRPQKLHEYQGNPLVEALPAEPNGRELGEQLCTVPSFDIEEMRSLDSEDRRLAIDMLKDIHIPAPVTHDLYKRIRRALFQGYRFRNPLAAETQRAMPTRGSPGAATPPWSQTVVPSLLYMAPSGKGKTTTINSILSLFPEVIEHTAYNGRSFYLKQPLFLKVDCPSNGSKRTLFESIFAQLDALVGSTYLKDLMKQRINLSSLTEELARICAQHYIGMIIIDELQNLRMEPPKSSGQGADVATLKFLDELFNRVGIPVLLIGTWRCAPLLTQRMETVRRAGTLSRVMESPYCQTDIYWTLLIETLWSKQLCQSPQPLTPEIRDYIYFASCGLPALAVHLLISAQQLALDSGTEEVTKRELTKIYDTEFLPLQNALHQLRTGNTAGYEDLIPPREILADSAQWNLS